MKTKKILSCIVAVLFALPLMVEAQTQPFSRTPLLGVGKQVVTVHSVSGRTQWAEGPLNLLINRAQRKFEAVGQYDGSTPYSLGNDDKWCDNSNAQPWVIFEIANYYTLDSVVFLDGKIREGYDQIKEYKIFVTDVAYDANVTGGWNDSDWTEVYHGTDQGEINVKHCVINYTDNVRYVKFSVISRGSNAIRVYGFDMYGSYKEPIDRNGVISVGKTILKSEEGAAPDFNRRETAVNILDGNYSFVDAKWCFGGFGQTKLFRYAVIDLEELYDITKFVLYDGNAGEPPAKNLDGVNIYTSTVAPNLGLINMLEADQNTCWEKVVDSENETGVDVKEYVIPSKTARFVKLEIPAGKAPDKTPGETSRIFEFEVYGTEIVVPIDDATLSLLTVSTGVLSPSFDPNTTAYTVNVPKEVETITIAASSMSKHATVTGAGQKALTIGDNNFQVTVTAEDRTTTKTYNVKVVRAQLSKVATLKSLEGSIGFFSPNFDPESPDTVVYYIDVPNEATQITLLGEATQADATITGLGTKTLSAQSQTFTVSVTSEDLSVTKNYTVTVEKEPAGLFSVNYGRPTGKRIVNIHSRSGQKNDTENPYKLLLGERLNTNGNTGNKWCDDSEEHWVIFSLAEMYNIQRIVIRNGLLMEASNSNVANIGGYRIEVSTTVADIYDDNVWTEIAADYDYPALDDIIDITGLNDDARYIRFTFDAGTKPDGGTTNTIWLYGIDLYGEKSTQNIDRKGVVSVGKTIVKHRYNYSDRETPCNLIDGNIDYVLYNAGDFETTKHDPWAFNLDLGNGRTDGWAIIDLENTYPVDSFKLYDKEDWLKGYEVYVSSTGSDDSWVQAFSAPFEKDSDYVWNNDKGDNEWKTIGPDPKIAKLANPVNARFVKLYIPQEYMASGWSRVREFEVYSGGGTGVKENLATGVRPLVVLPNPVAKGAAFYLNETGLLSVFNLQGALMLERAVIGASYISTDKLEKGSYIIRLQNENGIQQAKLIVK